MSQAVVQSAQVGEIMERLVQGDLSKLSGPERVTYTIQVCNSLGLNPATAPFAFLEFKGKTILYAKKDCTEQLRKRDNVSLEIVGRELLPDETYVVTARATIPGNPPRVDESIGAVSLKGLSGEARANGIMKAETKSKRRVTLSICGLGFLDESEVESLPGAEPVRVEVQQQQPAKTPQHVIEHNKPATIGADKVKEIEDLAIALSITPEAFAGRLLQLYGVNDKAKLTYAQADEILGKMRAAKEAKK